MSALRHGARTATMRGMNETPLSLTFAATFTEPATVDAPRRFTGVAYSGGLVPGYWQGDIAIDLSGITLPGGDIPILSSHVNDLSAICGKGRVRMEADAILIDGELATTKSGLEVAGLAASGVPLQLSVGLYQTSVEEFGGKTRKVECNGREMDLHAVIRSGTLREVSFVALGADPNTSVQIFKPAAQSPGAGHVASGEEEGDTMELEALNARVAELEAENAELKTAAEAARTAAREVEIKALFAAVGRDYNDDAAKPYQNLDAATFAAVAADLKSARPALDPALTREQATGGTSAHASFAAPHGYSVDAEAADLHAKALAWQQSHPGTDYLAAVKAVSQTA